MPRTERLHGRETFQRLFREGANVRGTWLNLIVRSNRLGKTRFSCSVRRHVAASAAARNHLKRLMREVFRKNKSAFPAGLDLMAIAVSLPSKADYSKVDREICNLSKCIDLHKK